MIFLLLIVIIVGLVILLPIIKNKNDLNNLYKETSLVNNYLNNKEKKENVQKYIDNNVTSINKELEDNIDEYSKLIIENDALINSLQDEKIFHALSKKNITNLEYDEELQKYFELTKNKLQESIDNLDNIEIQIKEEIIDLYHDIIEKINIDNYKKKINNLISDIDIINNSLLLLKNKDNYTLDDTIIFQKSKNFNEYKEIQDKMVNDFHFDNLDFQLIEDHNGPIIEANDLVLLKGDNNFGIKCIDEVDDEVECHISGDYDVNKVGTYDITINANDKNGNESSKTIKLTIKEQKVYKNPYYIEIIRNHNVVVVYGLDGNNEYTKIVKVFICSVGLNNWTPTGTFTTSKGYEWGSLNGGLYGQYSTRIRGSILFHSVPYYSMDKNQIEWEEFNKLGEPASQGCIRMTVEDVKWIYDNCASGVTVKIYDGDLPKNVVKPVAPKIDGTSPNKGWDPTDPDSNNPWKNNSNN